MFSQPQKHPGLLILSTILPATLLSLLLVKSLKAGPLTPSGSDYPLYLPFIQRGPTTPSLEPIQLACASDSWTVTWSNNDTAVTYQLQEAHDPNFTAPLTYTTMLTSQLISNPPSPHNIYHYQVRSTAGSLASNWSNSVSVVGSFFDDFTDPNSGWADGETSISTVGYDSGNYFIRTKDTGDPTLAFLATSLSPDVSRTNYIIEADIHWQSGSATDGLYGLVFGSTADLSKYYFVALFPDTQSYRLFYFDSTLPVSDRLQPLSPLDSNPTIQPGTAVNHVRLDRIGQNITLQINGIDLGSWMDNRLTGPTHAGVIAVANPNVDPVVEARFDNFKTSACPGATAVSPHHFKPTALISLTPPIPLEALFDHSK